MSLDYLDSKQRGVLDELHPELRAGIERVLERLDKRFVPLCGFRSGEEQLKRFRVGRDVVLDHNGRVLRFRKIGPTVTNARPFESPHNYHPALACDLVLNVATVKVGPHPDDPRFLNKWETGTPEAKLAWGALGVAAKAEGLVWGGTFRFVDLVHLELPNWRSRIGG